MTNRRMPILILLSDLGTSFSITFSKGFFYVVGIFNSISLEEENKHARQVYGIKRLPIWFNW